MLGSTFDYTAAASQLSQAAAAAQHITAADRRYAAASDITNINTGKLSDGTLAIGSSGQQAVEDAAAAATGLAPAWPVGVLDDVLPPLTKFYEHEDVWQDVGRFGQVCNAKPMYVYFVPE